MPRRLPVLLIAILAGTIIAMPSGACPFCNAEGQTLTKEVNLASLVIFGTIQKTTGGADFSVEGTTDFIVEKVIKSHDILDKELKKPAELVLVAVTFMITALTPVIGMPPAPVT